MLQAIVEEAKNKEKDLSIIWLDLSYAFGSVHHSISTELFDSLPLPSILKRILLDINSDTVVRFAVVRQTIEISPTAGVRQGDALSSTVFDLVMETLIRLAKS